ncbi:hypothetical protein THAOC_08989 [Thalassiosira oceanica]|uniref:Uncharacterized protein n=1 Tax=Thalassiosira oceanica TaxID=159749 RepID=K0STP4_THAOC|nr:hypothetical protein THAOC_08989 [Thalassiosira oceanica]|eukprot:EJK69723.1 hypothetical protein THAOC_08989 [Thalassiosira oceanica]
MCGNERTCVVTSLDNIQKVALGIFGSIQQSNGLSYKRRMIDHKKEEVFLDSPRCSLGCCRRGAVRTPFSPQQSAQISVVLVTQQCKDEKTERLYYRLCSGYRTWVA